MKTSYYGCLVPILLVFLIGAYFLNTNSDNSKPTVSSSTENDPAFTPMIDSEPRQSETPELNIGFHKHKFMTYFNATSKKLNIPLEITKTDKSITQNSPEIVYIVTNNIGIKASINQKDGTIRNLYMLGKGDGTPVSGAQILSTITVLVAMLHPDTPTQDLGNFLKSLNVNLDDPNQLSTEKQFENIKYRFTISPAGIIFSARNSLDPEND